MNNHEIAKQLQYVIDEHPGLTSREREVLLEAISRLNKAKTKSDIFEIIKMSIGLLGLIAKFFP